MSIRDVAGHAGVPASSIDYHFGNRDALLKAVMQTVTADFCLSMTSAAPSTGTVDEVLQSYVDVLAAGSAHSRGHHILLLEFTLYAARRPASGLAEWQYAQYEAAAHRVLDRLCVQSGSTFVGDRTVVVRFLLAVVEGVTLQQLASRDTQSVRPLLRDLAHALAPHLLPHPAIDDPPLATAGRAPTTAPGGEA